jgi:hypothetical protein
LSGGELWLVADVGSKQVSLDGWFGVQSLVLSVKYKGLAIKAQRSNHIDLAP